MGLELMIFCDFCEGNADAEGKCIFCNKDLCFHVHGHLCNYQDTSGSIEYLILNWWDDEREKSGLPKLGICPDCQESGVEYYKMKPHLAQMINDSILSWVNNKMEK